MACNLITKLASACTSGIGKLNDRLQLLRVWAQLKCEPPCAEPPAAPTLTSVNVTGAGLYTVNWTAVEGAVSYWVFIYEAPITDPPVQVNDANTTDIFAAFVDSENLERAAFVYAINACGDSIDSNIVYFNSGP